ncbi:MAG: tRNA (adenosine(37)-N6)-threonylcarbamoyltransferase complex ATPase subunit type 1 TsaE [Candidatus Velthaea sp.]
MQTQVPDMAALAAFAREFAAGLHAGDAVGVSGELGAGKTTLVRAVVRALHGSDDAVSSPTFVFRHRYAGTPPVEHLDLYRMNDLRELAELGLDDAFGPDCITFVEWPERAPELLPAGAIALRIAGSGDGPRSIRIRRV